MNPEKWAEDIAGSPYGLKSLSSPENKPSQKQQLLKSIFMHVTNASMPDTDEKRKNWDGKIFEDFTDSMPSIYHEKFKEQLEIQGIRYRETYKRTNSRAGSQRHHRPDHSAFTRFIRNRADTGRPKKTRA